MPSCLEYASTIGGWYNTTVLPGGWEKNSTSTTGYFAVSIMAVTCYTYVKVGYLPTYGYDVLIYQRRYMSYDSK